MTLARGKDSSESPEQGRDGPCLARLGAAAGEMGKLGSVIAYKGNYTVFRCSSNKRVLLLIGVIDTEGSHKTL